MGKADVDYSADDEEKTRIDGDYSDEKEKDGDVIENIEEIMTIVTKRKY